MKLATFIFQLSSPYFAASEKKDSGELNLMAVFSEKGLCGLSIAGKELPCPFCHGIDEFDNPQVIAQRFEDLKDKLLIRMNGGQADMDWRAFDLSDQPAYHVRVWKAMHAIPFGKIATYGQITKAAGSPKASRACGQACGANPILLFIPCHRVVSSTGLGGFGSGLKWKKRFLKMEGVDFRELHTALPSAPAHRLPKRQAALSR